MKKRLWMVLLLAGCGSGSDSEFFPSNVPDSTFSARGKGRLVADAATTAGFPKVLDPAILGKVSQRVTPADLSPVMDQGQLESCGAFGLAYEACGYEVRRSLRLTTQPQDCISPAYMYRRVLDIEGSTALTNDGTYAHDWFNDLVHHASANLATVPYPAPNTTAIDAAAIDGLVPAQIPVDPRMRIGSWAALPLNKNPKQLKDQIDAGHVIGIGVNLPQNFETFYHKTETFQGRGSIVGGHFLAVNDYDDTRQAFRVQNSWGTSFGDGGYLWWDYTDLMKFMDEAYVAEPVADLSSETSGGPLTGGSPQARLVSLQQGKDPSSAKVVLVFQVHLGESLRVQTYAVTTPGGQLITHNYHGHAMHNGELHFSRKDGNQWPSGRYTLTLRGENVSHTVVTLTGSGQLSPIPALSESEPLEVQGSDEQAAQLSR